MPIQSDATRTNATRANATRANATRTNATRANATRQSTEYRQFTIDYRGVTKENHRKYKDETANAETYLCKLSIHERGEFRHILNKLAPKYINPICCAFVILHKKDAQLANNTIKKLNDIKDDKSNNRNFSVITFLAALSRLAQKHKTLDYIEKIFEDFDFYQNNSHVKNDDLLNIIKLSQDIRPKILAVLHKKAQNSDNKLDVNKFIRLLKIVHDWITDPYYDKNIKKNPNQHHYYFKEDLAKATLLEANIDYISKSDNTSFEHDLMKIFETYSFGDKGQLPSFNLHITEQEVLKNIE